MDYLILLAYLLGLMATLAGVSSIAYGFYGMTVKKFNRSSILFSIVLGTLTVAVTFTLFKVFCV